MLDNFGFHAVVPFLSSKVKGIVLRTVSNLSRAVFHPPLPQTVFLPSWVIGQVLTKLAVHHGKSNVELDLTCMNNETSILGNLMICGSLWNC